MVCCLLTPILEDQVEQHGISAYSANDDPSEHSGSQPKPPPASAPAPMPTRGGGMHEFARGGRGRGVVVLSSLLGGAWFETGLGGTSAWRGRVRLGGCQAPRPSAFLAHRRQVLVTHSPLTESLSTLAAIARGVPRGSKVRRVVGSLPHASVVPPAVPPAG